MKRIREVGMLEWIYYIKPEYLLVVYIPQEVLENIVFTKAVRCALLGRTLALLRSSLMAILCRPGLILGEVITQFDLLTTRKIMVTAHSSNEGLFRLIIYFLSCCFCPLITPLKLSSLPICNQVKFDSWQCLSCDDIGAMADSVTDIDDSSIFVFQCLRLALFHELKPQLKTGKSNFQPPFKRDGFREESGFWLHT